MKPTQPWIYSAAMDGGFILAPALAISLLLLVFRDAIAAIDTMPIWLWGVLIVGVDVAHVYSTLYRTYVDRDEFRARRTLYLTVPLICWGIGTLLYSVDGMVFWRAIAYLAVFHFVRQQYGFMMIYTRRERAHWGKRIDQCAIYAATIYPLIYWHTHLPRHFDWFMEGDFVSLHADWLASTGLGIYTLIMGVYLLKEVRQTLHTHILNIPKNLLLLGTAISWWVGIITFDNDLAFTAANVLAHGIPYMALIWIYGRNQAALEPNKKLAATSITWKQFFRWQWIVCFIGFLVALAYLEEGLWDVLIWTEHKSLFAPFQFFPAIDAKETLAWLVPLLALPQLTHYALDGFIWRLKTPNTNWKRILFYRSERTA